MAFEKATKVTKIFTLFTSVIVLRQSSSNKGQRGNSAPQLNLLYNPYKHNPFMSSLNKQDISKTVVPEKWQDTNG